MTASVTAIAQTLTSLEKEAKEAKAEEARARRRARKARQQIDALIKECEARGISVTLIRTGPGGHSDGRNTRS